MSWDKAKERSDQTGPSIFVKLKDDGDKVIGCFVGEPHIRELFWSTKTDKYEDFTEEHRKAGKNSTPKYRLNFFVKENKDAKEPGGMKILEVNNATFKDVLKVKDKYGLDKKWFEIERNGKAKDTKTTYSILPDSDISAAELKLIGEAKLHDLEKTDDDAGDSTTDMKSHDKGKAGGDNGKPVDEPSITDSEKESLVARLKQLPKEKIDAFLAKFGVKQLKLLKVSQLAAAIAELDALEGKTTAPAATDDPFA